MASRYDAPDDKHTPGYILKTQPTLGHANPGMISSRFPHSTLHQRDPRPSSSLFDSYNSGERTRPVSRSPGRIGGYGGFSGSVNGGGMNGGLGRPGVGGGYRAATPNSKYVVPFLFLVYLVASEQNTIAINLLSLIGDGGGLYIYIIGNSNAVSWEHGLGANTPTPSYRHLNLKMTPR